MEAKRIFAIFLFFILAASVSCLFSRSRPEHDPDPLTERRTLAGSVVGYVEDNGAHAWLGIPYAKAPTGDLRWRVPRPPEKWEGIRKAVDLCPVCPQYGGLMGDVSVLDYNDPVGNEDCLYLNIWAPPFMLDEIPSEVKPLPVMFWIHGGGNSVGHGGSYNGKALAKKYKVIVITINYRLGPLGWFSHPALKGGALPEDMSGNYGTLDIIQALKWVKNNITNFGGDPENVTVFGESAGAMNTIILMLSPPAKGLFHKAISQSGMPFTDTLAKGENYRDDSKKGHRNSSKEVINRLLLADGIVSDRAQAKMYQDQMDNAKLAEYLRGKSAEELLSVYEPGAAGMISMPRVFRDGIVIPEGDPFEIFKDSSRYNNVPVILGTNRDENKIFMVMDSEYVSLISGVKDQEYYDLISGYLSKRWKAVGADELAIRLSENPGQRVYVYRFDWDEEPSYPGVDLSRLVGAAHSVEIPFVFNNFEDLLTGFSLFFSDDNREGRTALSESMSSYWAEFAYSGSPGRGRPGTGIEWKAWSNFPGKEKFIIFDTLQDNGIRMSPEAVRLADLKNRILSETRFKSQKKHCRIYTWMFDNTGLWNAEEYETLGAEGCGDFPRELFEW